MSADWSIRGLQSWTCSRLPTVAEFVKLTQSIVIEIQHSLQICTKSNFATENFCGCPSDLRGKGIRVSPAWYYSKRQRQLCLSTQQPREMSSDLKLR